MLRAYGDVTQEPRVGDGRLRPDFLVTLPNGEQIVAEVKGGARLRSATEGAAQLYELTQALGDSRGVRITDTPPGGFPTFPGVEVVTLADLPRWLAQFRRP